MEICTEKDNDYIYELPYCKVYRQISNSPPTYECMECLNGMFWNKASKTCSFSCSSVSSIISLIFDEKKTSKNSNNECLAPSSTTTYPNCEKVMQVSETTVPLFKCILCEKYVKVNKRLPVIISDGTSHLTHIIMFSRLTNVGMQMDHRSREQFVTCSRDTSTTNVFFNTVSNTVYVEECELWNYTKGSATVTDPNTNVTSTVYHDLYTCQRCKLGYTGIARDGYIESCTRKIIDCQSYEIFNLQSPYSQTLNQTFNIPLSNYATCFKCYNNKLPILFLSQNLQIKSFLYHNMEGYLSMCLEKNTNDFDLPDGTDLSAIIDNCGFFVKFVDATTPSATLTDSARSVFCSACKPGYKPVYTNDKISECVAIENCKAFFQKNFFNICPECKEGHSHPIDPVTFQMDYTSCVADVQDETCQIKDTVTNTCLKCIKGYLLNLEGQCETAKLSFCEDGQFSDSFYPLGTNVSYNLYQASLSHGCQKCYYSFLLQIDTAICVPTKIPMNALPQSTKMIPFCKFYLADDSDGLKCNTCMTDYVISELKTKCYPKAPLSNCLEALSETKCNLCESGFVVVNFACLPPGISKCLKFSQQPEQTTQSCLVCQEYHYLEDQVCKPGNLMGCKVYTSRTVCEKCSENSQHVVIDSVSYCYPIPPEQNCLKFDSQFTSGILNCQECKFNYSRSENIDDIQAQQCLEGQVIPHCKLYQTKDNLQNSSMLCSLCKEGFYLDSTTKQCIKRQNKDVFCRSYSDHSDTCLACDNGYYLSSTGHKCIVYPEGLVGCLKYSSKIACSLCKSNFYLKDTICEVLQTSELVANCSTYSSSKSCLTCVPNFHLKGSECIQVLAQNCKTTKDENTCKTCLSKDYGIKVEGPLTNCVLKNLAQCIESTDEFPFKCQVCSTSYLAQEGECVSVTTTIQNCEIYDSLSTCSLCRENYVLSHDKKTCTVFSNQFLLNDDNCYSFEQMEKSNCEVCQFGFYFDEKGSCVECSVHKKSTGCLSCNPNNDKECFMCASNFYQKTLNGECLPLETPIAVLPVSSSPRIRVLSLLLIVYANLI